MSDPISYPLQFGIYRDGDNNLDAVQAALLTQAKTVTAQDSSIYVNVLDATRRDTELHDAGALRTESYELHDGEASNATVSPAQDMAERKTLAAFVEHTLDLAEANNARQTWLDLVDHGGGDSGAFQTNMSGGGVMREDDIAGAIRDGVSAHAKAHPQDADRRVDGVIFNACLMATLGAEASLSHAGVRYLAASPETMIAPGVPSSVAHDIAEHQSDPIAAAKAIVDTAMDAVYREGYAKFHPAAAFDVFDLDAKKIGKMERAVAAVNKQLVSAAGSDEYSRAIKADARKVPGMTRNQEPGLPWHADRPAEQMYQNFATDTGLPDALRKAAGTAVRAIADTVLAHREATRFAPFDGASYSDAAGPTVHFPLSRNQIDPWAPQMSETDTAFAGRVHQSDVAEALLA